MALVDTTAGLSCPRDTLAVGGRSGSALAVTIILCVLVSAIVGSYLKLATTELKMSDRAFRQNSALNLAEIGVEDAAWSLNNNDWADWTTVRGSHVKRVTNIDLGDAYFGTYTTFVYRPDRTPVIFSEGKTTDQFGNEVIKQVRVEVVPRSVFANGMTAEGEMVFGGGEAYVDSYESRTGKYHYSTNSADNGSAASETVSMNRSAGGNLTVRGMVATGGSDPSFGSEGGVYGDDSDLSPGERIDGTRVASDFSADHPDVEVPYFESPNRSLDLARRGTTVIGSTGTREFPEVYMLRDLDLNEDQVLEIDGYVTIVTERDSTVEGMIRVMRRAALEWYTEGDLTIARNMLANETNVPANFTIYGTDTRPGGTTIALEGMAMAAVYAPNSTVRLGAEIDARGRGRSEGRGRRDRGEEDADEEECDCTAIFGGVVAHEIEINGDASFHFDESLQNFTGGATTYRVSDWRELTHSSDRLDFSSMYVRAVDRNRLPLGRYARRYSSWPGNQRRGSGFPVVDETDPATCTVDEAQEAQRARRVEDREEDA